MGHAAGGPAHRRAAAILTGHGDFVLIVTKAWTGMRWGEVAGLERPRLWLSAIQVDWQLCERQRGRLRGRRHVGLLRRLPPFCRESGALSWVPFHGTEPGGTIHSTG
jgi:hypothetical protein